MFKKLTINEALEKETNTDRKKQLEEYNNELCLFLEFLSLTGGVKDQQNGYKEKMKLAIKELMNNCNTANIEIFETKITQIYDQWIHAVKEYKTPSYLDNFKKLAIDNLEAEKIYLIRQAIIEYAIANNFMSKQENKQHLNELKLLDKAQTKAMNLGNLALQGICTYFNKRAKKIGVEPNFQTYYY